MKYVSDPKPWPTELHKNVDIHWKIRKGFGRIKCNAFLNF